MSWNHKIGMLLQLIDECDTFQLCKYQIRSDVPNKILHLPIDSDMLSLSQIVYSHDRFIAKDAKIGSQ